jgi:endo-1,4-beta-mannosidase
MDRRSFVAGSVVAAGTAALRPVAAALPATSNGGLNLTRHRFGVNYTPSHNWWFCWNDWNADPIRRDLDAIAALGTDHLRLMLIWPFFQPNPRWVSPAHPERLDQLITLMAERRMDALVTVFTGQLSGWYFLPPFSPRPGSEKSAGEDFFTGSEMRDAQELFVRELARTLRPHANVIGFDMGNEINTCWQAPTQQGDAWMQRMFALMNDALPDHLHVNGVDHNPWFREDTFSPQALAAARFPVMHCYPYWTGAVKYGGAMDPPSVKLLAGMAALIRSYAGTQQKPVWAGEFNTCIKELSDKEQAEWLEKAALAAIEQGVSWFSYWDTHDVDRKFAFNPLEYTLGLLTNEGRVKEQGRVFQQLATAYRGKPVVFPRGSAPAPPSERTLDGTWRWLLDWMEWKPVRS